MFYAFSIKIPNNIANPCINESQRDIWITCLKALDYH